MNKIKTTVRGAVFFCLAMVCVLRPGGRGAQAAAMPVIAGQEAVLYLDGKDEISVLGENIRSVTYSSDAPDVAVVDSAGMVTPVGQGTAKIRARVIWGEDGSISTADLSYQLQVIDSSDNYFTYNNDRITGMKTKGKALRDVYIPGWHRDAKITAVYEDVFDGDQMLERVFLSDNIEYLDYVDWDEDVLTSSAFDGCSGLREIHLGKNLRSVGYLKNLSALQTITVHPENVDFRTEDNVLFSGDHLVYYAAGKPQDTYVLPENVTVIDSYAFSGAGNLSKIRLHDKLKTIAGKAFENSGLSEVRIPVAANVGYRAFYNCRNLNKAILPDQMLQGSYVFENCTALKIVVLPRTATAVSADSFAGCSALEGFQIADGAGECDFVVRDGVLYRYNGTVLEAYPPGKREEEYVVPYDVEQIRDRGFYGAVKLKRIMLCTSVSFVGNDAFANCTSLTKIHLKKKVYLSKTGSSKGYFWGCKSLKEITVDAGNSNYVSRSGVLYSKNNKVLLCYPQARTAKKFTVPKSVSRIGTYAFSENRYLQELVAGKNVKRIGDSAFSGAKQLRRVTLGAKVEDIDKEAFRACKKLQKIVIPDRVVTLSEGMFSECSAVREIVVGKSVKYIKDSAFAYCRSLKRLTFRGKKWQNGLEYDTVFVRTGSKKYSSLTVSIPKCSGKEKTACRRALRSAGLHRSAKIQFSAK